MLVKYLLVVACLKVCLAEPEKQSEGRYLPSIFLLPLPCTKCIYSPTLEENVEGVPSGPTNLHATYVGTNSVILAWTTPNISSLNLATYELHWNNAFTNEKRRISVPLANTFTLSDLEPDTLYYFWIVAKTKRGIESEMSSHAIVRTLVDDDPNVDLIVLKNKSYYLGNRDLSYYQALINCHEKNMELVSIDNEEENLAIYNMVLDYGEDGHSYWTSGKKSHVDGKTWVWANNKPITYFNWQPGEPNNAGVNEDCLELYINEKQSWNDDPCDRRRYFICEKLNTPEAMSLRSSSHDIKQVFNVVYILILLNLYRWF